MGELNGRLPVVMSLHPLNLEQLTKYLNKPERVIVKHSRELMEKNKADLHVTDSALHTIRITFDELQITVHRLHHVVSCGNFRPFWCDSGRYRNVHLCA